MRTKPLSEACEIIMGQAPPGDTYNEEGLGLPLIAGAGDFGDVSPSPSKFSTAARKKSRLGDIILCVRATIGDLNWSDREYCLGRGVAGLRVKAGQADMRYIWRVIEFHADRLRALGRGATFKQISRADIVNFQVPLPSFPEQRRIAAILDQADGLRRKQQRAVGLLETLPQAVLSERFLRSSSAVLNWPVLRLADLILDGDRINYGVVQPGDETEAGVPLVRAGIQGTLRRFRRN
jgi:type I restriction enzyme S subunit